MITGPPPLAFTRLPTQPVTLSIPQLRGGFEGGGKRFAIVASSFNQRLVSQLLEGAVDCLIGHGVAAPDIAVVRVPGAWEIPQALEELAARGGVDALITIGVVIRGDTPHFDYICAECTSGAGRVASKYRIPVALGVLTCDTTQQAEERAGGKGGNKGAEAALAALEMASLFHQLRA
jgi:6,7-dimethyl-8-ribityllumazine synthase